MTKHENHLKNFLDEPEVKKIITDCELLFAGYQMIEMFKITVREVGGYKFGKDTEPQIEITISSNCRNGISEYTRTYRYNG